MYFSVLPLLLLFSSAICAQASPIHIKSRMDSSVPPTNGVSADSTSLAASHKNNALYVYFSSHIESYNGNSPVMGLPGALKTTYEGSLIIKFEITRTAIRRVNIMIPHLSASRFSSWGWGDVPQNDFKPEPEHHFVVILQLRGQEEEKIVRDYLYGYTVCGSTSAPMSLAASRKNNLTYVHFSSIINPSSGTRVMGLPGALKITWEGDLIIKFEITRMAVHLVNIMIPHLSASRLTSWGWGDVPQNDFKPEPEHHFVVILRLREQEEEKIVRAYLRGYTFYRPGSAPSCLLHQMCLAASHKNNHLYVYFSSIINPSSGTRVMGLPGALKITWAGDLIIKFEITRTAVHHVNVMIPHLSVRNWGWGDVPQNDFKPEPEHRFVVILRLREQPEEEEEIMRDYLHGRTVCDSRSGPCGPGSH